MSECTICGCKDENVSRERGTRYASYFICDYCISEGYSNNQIKECDDFWRCMDDKENATLNFQKYLMREKVYKGAFDFLDVYNFLKLNFNEEMLNIIKTMDYDDFLKSEYWATVSQDIRYSFSSKCFECGNKDNLHIHHENYDVKGFEWMHADTRLAGKLLCLCEKCHAKKHGKEI